MTRPISSRERAEAFLRSRIDQAKPTDVPVSALASEAGVPYATMWRVARGHGLARRPSGDAAPKRLAWQVTRDAVLARIDDGTYRAGHALPSAKHLCVEHGIAYRTVRKALVSLADDGYVEARGRGYVAPTPAVDTPSASVLCVLRGSGPDEIMPLGGRSKMILRELERACTRMRIGLHIHTVYMHGTSMRGIADISQSLDSLRTKTVLGAMVFTMGVPAERVLRQTLSADVPTVVLDENGLDDMIRRCCAGHEAYWFSMAHSPRDGEIVAHHLLSMGHRRVTYVSTESQAGAARERGLVEAFRRRDGTVSTSYLSDRDPDDARQRDFNVNENAIVQGLRRINLNLQHSHDVRVVMYRWIGHAERNMVLRCAIADQLLPLLRSDTGTTAVVCYNDDLAVVVKEMLVSEPALQRRLSLVSFDDSENAAHHRLTSYNNNCERYVEEMLKALLMHPSRQRGSPRLSPTYIPGFMTERGSVGRHTPDR